MDGRTADAETYASCRLLFWRRKLKMIIVRRGATALLPDQIQAYSHCADPGYTYVSGRRPSPSSRWFTLSSAIRRALMGSERVARWTLTGCASSTVQHNTAVRRSQPSSAVRRLYLVPADAPRRRRVSGSPTDTSPASVRTCSFWPCAEVP